MLPGAMRKSMTVGLPHILLDCRRLALCTASSLRAATVAFNGHAFTQNCRGQPEFGFVQVAVADASCQKGMAPVHN